MIFETLGETLTSTDSESKSPIVDPARTKSNDIELSQENRENYPQTVSGSASRKEEVPQDIEISENHWVSAIKKQVRTWNTIEKNG